MRKDEKIVTFFTASTANILKLTHYTVIQLP